MQLIDTSAVVRFFSKEEGWERIEPHISEAMTLTLTVSELGNALLKKVQKKEIQLKIASEMLTKYAQKALLLHDEEYAETAIQTAHANGITVYDGMFIAACIEEGLDLVTCDSEQAKVAGKLGIMVTEV